MRRTGRLDTRGRAAPSPGDRPNRRGHHCSQEIRLSLHQCAVIGKTIGAIRAQPLPDLLGPSGCGKTTTLMSIAGLHTINSGAIEVGGLTYTEPSSSIFLPPEKRDIGMVFQSYAIWPHMTVTQNVAYP